MVLCYSLVEFTGYWLPRLVAALPGCLATSLPRCLVTMLSNTLFSFAWISNMTSSALIGQMPCLHFLFNGNHLFLFVSLRWLPGEENLKSYAWVGINYIIMWRRVFYSMTSRFPPFAFAELVSPYNKKNITRWLEDMNFMFSWQEQ